MPMRRSHQQHYARGARKGWFSGFMTLVAQFLILARAGPTSSETCAAPGRRAWSAGDRAAMRCATRCGKRKSMQVDVDPDAERAYLIQQVADLQVRLSSRQHAYNIVYAIKRCSVFVKSRCNTQKHVGMPQRRVHAAMGVAVWALDLPKSRVCCKCLPGMPETRRAPRRRLRS